MHKAVIVGAGRIGAGYNWPKTPFVYTHADTYLALKDRVELVGFVETDNDRLMAVAKKYGLESGGGLEAMLDRLQPDIISVCTPPDVRGREEILAKLYATKCVKGIWLEKPSSIKRFSLSLAKPVQVNYIRRFEQFHVYVKELLSAFVESDVISFNVAAKKDIHTVCHFTDLARFWGIPKHRLSYVNTLGLDYLVTEYDLLLKTERFKFAAGGEFICHFMLPEASKSTPAWTDQRWNPTFMEAALSNLLDTVEGKAELTSPLSSAMKSEEWANEILKEAGYA